MVWAHDPEREKEIFELGLGLGGSDRLSGIGDVYIYIYIYDMLWDIVRYEHLVIIASCDDGTFTSKVD